MHPYRALNGAQLDPKHVDATAQALLAIASQPASPPELRLAALYDATALCCTWGAGKGLVARRPLIVLPVLTAPGGVLETLSARLAELGSAPPEEGEEEGCSITDAQCSASGMLATACFSMFTVLVSSGEQAAAQAAWFTLAPAVLIALQWLSKALLRLLACLLACRACRSSGGACAGRAGWLLPTALRTLGH